MRGRCRMKNITGKFFLDVQTRKIKTFEYSNMNNYYAFVQEKQQMGFVQSIVTTDIMISIMEKYVLSNAQILSIEFMVEDPDLEDEISMLLENMKRNAAQWTVLKQRLMFLSTDSSIDIRKIEVKSIEHSYIASIMVNGLITVTDTAYNKVTGELCHLLEGQIK